MFLSKIYFYLYFQTDIIAFLDCRYHKKYKVVYRIKLIMDGRDIDEDDNDDQVHIMTNGTLVSKSGISLEYIDRQ